MRKFQKAMALSVLLAMSVQSVAFAGVVKSNAAKVVETTDTTASSESGESSSAASQELQDGESGNSEAGTNSTSNPSDTSNTSASQNTSNTLRKDTSNYGPGMNLPKNNSNSLTITMPDGVKTSEVTLKEDSKYYPYLWRETGQVPNAKAYVFEPANFNGKTVFLDPGHGDNSSPVVYQKNEKSYPLTDEELTAAGDWFKGYGVGAQARTFANVFDNKEIEPEFALRIALQTRDLLLSRGYKVVLSRTELNQNLSNGSRAVLAGQTSDIMISIHSNASNAKTAHGTIAFYPGERDYLSGRSYPGYLDLMGLRSNQAASKKLADSLVNQLSSQVGFQNLGTAEAVLRIFTYSSIPTSLVEVGFSDNMIDAQLLIEKKAEISKSIADSVDAYFR